LGNVVIIQEKLSILLFGNFYKKFPENDFLNFLTSWKKVFSLFIVFISLVLYIVRGKVFTIIGLIFTKGHGTKITKVGLIYATA
jgi:hypothetical protein